MGKQSFEKILPNSYTLPPTTLPTQSIDMDYNKVTVAEPPLEVLKRNQYDDGDMIQHGNKHVDLITDTKSVSISGSNMYAPLTHPKKAQRKIPTQSSIKQQTYSLKDISRPSNSYR